MISGLCISVIDPLNRTGKVSIPAHLVCETKGLDDYRAAARLREAKDFSLCLLFQKGRCNAGARCHQVHASAEFVNELRLKAASCKNCCADHGDVHSQGYINLSVHTTIAVVTPTSGVSGGHVQRYPLSAFGRTAFLDTLLRGNTSAGDIRVSAAKVCRLHTQRRCKFGKDCKNIHLCPDAVELEVVPSSGKGGCPSIDMSCGISCRSQVSSKPASLSESPNVLTPRDSSSSCARDEKSGPLSVDLLESGTHGCSSFFFSDEKMWGSQSASVMTAELDMSAFEATMRVLCDDIERAEFSPGCATRVSSQGKLFAE